MYIDVDVMIDAGPFWLKPFWLKLWSWQWSNRFCCSPKTKVQWWWGSSLPHFGFGALLSVDVRGTKARLWSQRCRVLGWEADLLSVALWIARLKALWPWRGSTSTLALAADGGGATVATIMVVTVGPPALPAPPPAPWPSQFAMWTESFLGRTTRVLILMQV